MLRKAFSPNFARFVRLSTSSWYPFNKAGKALAFSSLDAFLKSGSNSNSEIIAIRKLLHRWQEAEVVHTEKSKTGLPRVLSASLRRFLRLFSWLSPIFKPCSSNFALHFSKSKSATFFQSMNTSLLSNLKANTRNKVRSDCRN